MKKQPTDLTFDGLSRLLSEGTADEKVMKWLDTLAGALLVLSPAAIGAPVAAGLAFIGAKNELVKAGTSIIGKLAQRKMTDRLTRQELLLAAYCLTCYTAFFEAVDRLMPDLRKELDLQPSDQLRLTENALRGIGERHGAMTEDVFVLAKHRIRLPHPNDLVEENAAQLNELYEHMSRGFFHLVKDFAAWDNADEAARDRIGAAVRELPTVAKAMYRGQYQALCAKFHEFSVWANLREHTLTRGDLAVLATDVRAVLELMSVRPDGSPALDIGLADLAAAVARAVPAGEVTQNLDEALTSLGVAYANEIESPVIDDTYASTDGMDLQYPRKSEIFVPQAFRALRFDKPDMSLEHERVWHDKELQHDIGRYVLAHLTSPYSLEKPLVILGQPGSGKSLLTEVLAARLASVEYHPIRVTLRDINPDSDVQTQIEEQIRADTGRDVNWAELVARCGGRPPLVILDGYDELLQASGRVFSTYLMSVAAFQRREHGLGRPVRVLVTSRVTLIDKAEVPAGSTILRLEEFDDERQRKWAGIWNATNGPYFESRQIQPFTLPDNPDVLNLARQPLLLLMLALYDSDGNRLSRQQALDQTALYHNLLRRFIRRERGKGEEDGAEFRALPPKEAEKIVRGDLDRLGVAAIGMFNRRTLQVSKAELDQDLKYFGVQRTTSSGPGVRLGQAELLLGSFFFVHESRSRLRQEPDVAAGGPASFEFLHNTFGEFLAAEWILTTVLAETERVREMQANPMLHDVLHQRLENGLPSAWFTTLMMTPLFSRPVVLAMVREWSAHRLATIGREVEEFTEDLETIFYSQSKRLLSDGALPPMLLSGEETPFHRASALTNIATYTLNLVLLRCAIGGPFQVDLSRLASDSFPKPWSNIVDLWRAGLGQDGLMAVSTVLSAQVDRTGVELNARPSFTSQLSGDYLHRLYELGRSVGDDELTALAGWALQDTDLLSPPPLDELHRLPTIAGTIFQQEIENRLVARELAAGVRSEPPPPPDRRTASTFFSNPDAFYTTDDDLEIFIHAIPEIAQHIWKRAQLFEYREVSTTELEYFVLNRPKLAADMILLASKFNRSIIRSDPNFINKSRPRFASEVAKVATALAQRSPENLADSVLYELLAHSRKQVLADSIVERLLGESARTGEIASRSRATVIRLFARSKGARRYGWTRAVIGKLGGHHGPQFAHRFDSATLMTFVRLVVEHLNASPRNGIDPSHLQLRGLPLWIEGHASESNDRLITEEFLRLADSASKEWKAALEIKATHIRAAIRKAELYGKDFSVVAREAAERLREEITRGRLG